MTETTNPLGTHGMTMDGAPAMPILVAEYNALVARVKEAEGRLAAMTTPTDRAAVLRKAADWFERDGRSVTRMFGHQVATELRRLAGEAQQDETQAHPPYHVWYVETRDGLADQWAPGMRFPERADAAERYQNLSEHHPLWKDGTPVERRLVRETTSYTVEPAVVSQPGKEA